MAEQQRQRRAHILETARRLIAERGYEAVTVRDLAERCRVSVPTLYNQFGGKDKLLATAIEDHFSSLLATARQPDAPEGLPRLVELIDRCAQHMLERDGYHRRLLAAFTSLDATAEIQQRLAERLAAALAAQLTTLRLQRRLAGWVDVGLLAGQITSACIGTAVIWSGGHLPGDRLLPGMRYAAGLVLLGALRGAAARTLEAWLVEAQAALAEAPALAEIATTRRYAGNNHTGE
ncbi:MAG: TetR/AcrR family transcriptional regulator [Pseudomonadales bacterium]